MFEFLSDALVRKFVKFIIVGFSGVFVDFGFTYAFKEFLKIQKFISNAIGFTLAATSNYFLNRMWTFRSHNPEMMVEFGNFFLISMIGLVINTLILYLIVTKFKINFYISKLFAIGVVTLWNFAANSYFTFHVG